MQNNDMRNNLTIFSTLKAKSNILTIIFIVGLLIIFVLQIYTLNQIDLLKRKVDHRYFNITNSLEDIHHVEIETLHGRVYDSMPKSK